MARVLHLSGEQVLPLTAGWTVAASATAPVPTLASTDTTWQDGWAEWLPAQVPGTVAGALRQVGKWNDESGRDFDREQVIYRCRFPRPSVPAGARVALRLEGLATVCGVFLNGRRLLESASMYVAHELALSAELLAEDNQLVLWFAPLAPLLKVRRPRPRWKTRVVAEQNLRFFRTTWLGRMPGWTPLAPPVGPYRAISLVIRDAVQVDQVDAHADHDGEAGWLTLRLEAEQLLGGPVVDAEVFIGTARFPLEVEKLGAHRFVVSGKARVPGLAPWWPHTHGPPARHPVRVRFTVDARVIEVDLGLVGFRSLRARTEPGLGLSVNGVEVFCRGSVWTSADLATLASDEASLRPWLTTLRDGGMNMVRLGGTMAYESDAFFSLCDELGILVWQEFMFANMDYPVQEESFRAEVKSEAWQLLSRTQLSASLAVLCGGSEVEQQASMLGLPPSDWQSALFTELLAGEAAKWRPEVPYLSSSPTGGDLPFQVDRGVGHYYGVGAYQRPLEDARRARVAFASESLAFANVPDPRSVDELLRPGGVPVHHPRWKARVPRDVGSGWDFEDTRDFYLQSLFGVDPVRLRASDMERYLALSRIVSGEVMGAVFSEWRRPGNGCAGGLIWNYQDLWLGAGWGIVDSAGRPKAAYYGARRVLTPRAVVVTDEGVNGLHLHALNESAQPLSAQLRLTLYREGRTVVASGTVPVEVPARGGVTLSSARVLGGFLDVTYAYRFGPPSHDVAVAALLSEAGEVLHRAFYFPLGMPVTPRELGLRAKLEAAPAPGEHVLTVESDVFAPGCFVELRNATVSDNYFHLEPGQPYSVQVRMAPGATPDGDLWCLAAHQPLRLRAAEVRP